MSTPHDLKHSDPAVSDSALAESLGRGHEQRDTMLKPIIVFVIVLVISVIVVQLAVLWLQDIMKHQDLALDPSPPKSLIGQSLVSDSLKDHVPPAEPRLQPSPFHPSFDHEDWQALLARWDEQLTTVGKFADSDRVHIPVDRVIDMVSEKGLASLKPAAVSENK